jgi:hypothetical protein
MTRKICTYYFLLEMQQRKSRHFLANFTFSDKIVENFAIHSLQHAMYSNFCLLFDWKITHGTTQIFPTKVKHYKPKFIMAVLCIRRLGRVQEQKGSSKKTMYSKM